MPSSTNMLNRLNPKLRKFQKAVSCEGYGEIVDLDSQYRRTHITRPVRFVEYEVLGDENPDEAAEPFHNSEAENSEPDSLEPETDIKRLKMEIIYLRAVLKVKQDEVIALRTVLNKMQRKNEALAHANKRECECQRKLVEESLGFEDTSSSVNSTFGDVGSKTTMKHISRKKCSIAYVLQIEES